MSTPTPKIYSHDKFKFIDYRVFFADMKFTAVRRSDHCIIQSEIKTMPKELWVECIELTFNGASMENLGAVYDFMFDNHPTHRAVLDAVNQASIAISNLGYFRSN